MNEKMEEEAHNREYQAWIEMFDCWCSVLGMSKEELNKKQYRPAFEAMEKWAFYEYQRRLIMKDGKQIGLFWKDER